LRVPGSPSRNRARSTEFRSAIVASRIDSSVGSLAGRHYQA
jgi:hypothetical protein